jgi:hypothetical protein
MAASTKRVVVVYRRVNGVEEKHTAFPHPEDRQEALMRGTMVRGGSGCSGARFAKYR